MGVLVRSKTTAGVGMAVLDEVSARRVFAGTGVAEFRELFPRKAINTDFPPPSATLHRSGALDIFPAPPVFQCIEVDSSMASDGLQGGAGIFDFEALDAAQA